jgi:hypothetical protein
MQIKRIAYKMFIYTQMVAFLQVHVYLDTPMFAVLQVHNQQVHGDQPP